jgi:hypothetical protein
MSAIDPSPEKRTRLYTLVSVNLPDCQKLLGPPAARCQRAPGPAVAPRSACRSNQRRHVARVAIGRRLHPLVDRRIGTAATKALATPGTLELLLGGLLVLGPGGLHLAQQFVVAPPPSQVLAKQRACGGLQLARVGTAWRAGALLVKVTEPLVKHPELHDDPRHLGPCHVRVPAAQPTVQAHGVLLPVRKSGPKGG